MLPALKVLQRAFRVKLKAIGGVPMGKCLVGKVLGMGKDRSTAWRTEAVVMALSDSKVIWKKTFALFS